MTDPEMDEAVSNEAELTEKKTGEDRDEEEEEEDQFIIPSHWWLVSTAFPLIAGTFGPMASAFSVCALAARWRVLIPPGGSIGSGIQIKNPIWLTAINAAQLLVAFVSNLFLFLNMANRVRFAIAQPITIVGWYISSFALIALCATAAGPLKLSVPDYAFSQAFYYGIISAGLYFVIATLMVLTAIKVSLNHHSKGFKLTKSQRILMIQTISFLIYLLLGALVYAHIEDWDFLDAVYWADYTLLTIGIGNFAPATNLGRGLLLPYAITGILVLGLIVTSIRSLVLEGGKTRLTARTTEKARQRVLNDIKKENSYFTTPISNGPSLTHGNFYDPQTTTMTEWQRRQKEFEIMRKIQKHAEFRKRWVSLAVSATVWFMLLFVGAAIFKRTERSQQWTYLDALYFTYTSLLTIGYGDIFPQSSSGVVFFVFWSLLAIPSLTILISNMGDTIVRGVRVFTLWVGDHTVLPGEGNAVSGAKKVLHKFLPEKVLPSNIGERAPGPLGEADKRGNDDVGATSHRKDDAKSAGQQAAGDEAKVETAQKWKEWESGNKDALLKSKRHYQHILIKEISGVIKHLDSDPPRKYTFDEWEWYLKLIGEDEDSLAMRGKDSIKPLASGGSSASAPGVNGNNTEKRAKWSWVGNESPLMGNKKETEWVLARLTRTLERELKEMKEEELERERRRGKED